MFQFSVELVSICSNAMKVLHRIGLFMYNFLSVLSFNYTIQGFKVSIFTSISNCLKLPISIMFCLYLFYSPDFFGSFIADTAKFRKAPSHFSDISMLFINYFTMMTSLTICFQNLKRQEEILTFLNKANHLRRLFKEKFKTSFKKSIEKVAILISLVILIYVIMQYSYMKNDFLSIFIVFQILYPFLVLLCFLGFVKSIEYFFVASLKSFSEEIKEHLSNPNAVDIDSDHLIKQYQSIFKLNQEFNDLFGLQMTTATCCIAVMMTIDVSWKRTQHFCYELIFHCSSSKHFKLLLENRAFISAHHLLSQLFPIS